MDTKPVFHGSDIEKICSYYNLKKENIVKFGANVNPLGLSPKAGRAIAEHVDILSSYPDREYTSLRNTISSYCNIPADFILPGNGSSELISLLIQERAPKHTLILGPTILNTPESSLSPEVPRNTTTFRKAMISSRTFRISAGSWSRAMIFSSSATPTIRPPLPSPRKSFADLSVSVQKKISS